MFLRLSIWLGVFLSNGAAGGDPHAVLALVGEDAVLPHAVPLADGVPLPLVEWSKEGLGPQVVFLYRDGVETYEMKHPDFEFRTNLFMSELRTGNVSLRISGVRMSDGGSYTCLLQWQNKSRQSTTFRLDVAAVSEPTLRVTSAGDDGVTVECEAPCWPLDAQMAMVDGGQNRISQENLVRKDAVHDRGCYRLKLRGTLRSPTGRVICRVQDSRFNRTAEILFPVTWVECSYKNVILGVSLSLLLLFLVLLGMKFSKKVKRKLKLKRKSSEEEEAGSTSENSCLLKTVVTDGPDSSKGAKLSDSGINVNPSSEHIGEAASGPCRDFRTARPSSPPTGSQEPVSQHSDLSADSLKSLNDKTLQNRLFFGAGLTRNSSCPNLLMPSKLSQSDGGASEDGARSVSWSYSQGDSSLIHRKSSRPHKSTDSGFST